MDMSRGETDVHFVTVELLKFSLPVDNGCAKNVIKTIIQGIV